MSEQRVTWGQIGETAGKLVGIGCDEGDSSFHLLVIIEFRDVTSFNLHWI